MYKGVHPFPKGISQKVIVIMWTEFELAYYDVIVQHVCYSDTETLLFKRIIIAYGAIKLKKNKYT